MGHITLLGDSIFDNGVYVPGQPDVVKQLRAVLPDGWTASLCAVDGAVTRSVAAQLQRVPRETTHLVVSVGGNDALGQSRILSDPVRSVAEAVLRLSEAQRSFAEDYGSMLDAVLSLGPPVVLCTIYDTPTNAPKQRVIRTALSLFNDEISRAAFVRGLGLVDLRLICDSDEDYANPIEPSARGGAKIAAAIAGLVTGGSGRRSTVASS